MMARTERELAQRWPLIMATCMGIISSSFVLPYYSIGALLTPVTEEFGWSRAQFQAAILFSSGLGALTSPLIGWLNDKYLSLIHISSPRDLSTSRMPSSA